MSESKNQKIEILQEEYNLFKDLTFAANALLAKGNSKSHNQLEWKRLETTLVKLGMLHETHGIQGFLRGSDIDA